MENKMIYDFINDSYISPSFHSPYKIYNFRFNKQIGFNECYKIQEDIKKNILDGIYNFKIDYSNFINEIDIICESTIEYDPELFYSDSKLELIENNKLTIKLIDRNWNNVQTKQYFDYNIIRFSLYIAYYKYLKKNNPAHLFVKFIDDVSNNYQNIDESLFQNMINIGNDLRLNKNKINFNLE